MSEEKLPKEIEITLPTAQQWVKKYKETAVDAESRAAKIDGYLIPIESQSLRSNAYLLTLRFAHLDRLSQHRP